MLKRSIERRPLLTGLIAGTSDLAFLLYYNNAVYQMNHSNNWFGPVTTSSGGSATTDPRL